MSLPVHVAAAIRMLDEMTNDHTFRIHDMVVYQGRTGTTPMKITNVYYLHQPAMTQQDMLAQVDAFDRESENETVDTDMTFPWANTSKRNMVVKLEDPFTHKTVVDAAAKITPLPAFTGKSYRTGVQWSPSDMTSGLYWFLRTEEPSNPLLRQIKYTPTRAEVENNGPLTNYAAMVVDELKATLVSPKDIAQAIQRRPSASI